MTIIKTNERLKQLRENKELTQKELADLLHMDRSVYNKIESGARPIRDNELIQFADFYNVSTDYLTNRTNNPIPPEEKTNVGQNIISHFRLNTSDMDIENIEELEEELIDFQDFLIKKAKEKKERNKKN